MIGNKTAIFFDLDHTLWDFEKNSALAFEEIINKYDIGVHHNDFNAVYSPINAQYWKLYRDGHITQQELRYGRLRDCFAQMDYEVNSELLHVLSEEYIGFCRKTPIFLTEPLRFLNISSLNTNFTS